MKKEVKMITGIFLIPTLHVSTSRDAKAAVKTIVYQLGVLNCDYDNDCAMLRYNDILSNDVKSKLKHEAATHGHRILFLEAEDKSSFIDDNTFHIPTDEEMIVHLERLNKI
ncbi:MAG: hypothetical protein IKY26_05955 [Erysipelotrichaceae bacterium]|nr:hypothetical protein [Erysipelotrichaceae bacterium]